MPAHSGLTGASLHESKGAAAATAGQVAVADGAGAAPFGTLVNGSLGTGMVAQIVRGSTTTFTSLSGTIPFDNTVPQNTEGDEILTVAITPKSTTNKLLIRAVVNLGCEQNQPVIIALFQDTTAGALAAASVSFEGTNDLSMSACVLEYEMAAGTTSETTFKIRAGGRDGVSPMQAYVNGGDGIRRFGGVAVSSLTITEYKAS